jgi:hypothetical protein
VATQAGNLGRNHGHLEIEMQRMKGLCGGPIAVLQSKLLCRLYQVLTSRDRLCTHVSVIAHR